MRYIVQVYDRVDPHQVQVEYSTEWIQEAIVAAQRLLEAGRSQKVVITKDFEEEQNENH